MWELPTFIQCLLTGVRVTRLPKRFYEWEAERNGRVETGKIKEQSAQNVAAFLKTSGFTDIKIYREGKFRLGPS